MSLETLLVTGHLGFVGSGFCARYGQRYQLCGTDYLSANGGGLIENLQSSVIDERVDIADRKQLEALLDRRAPDAIINFAAETHIEQSMENDTPFWQSNLLGARNLALEAQARGIRMVHVSTDEVYGDAAPEAKAWTETTPLDPHNPYAVTKASADMLLRSYALTHEADIVITRGTHTIGPRQSVQSPIARAMRCFMNGEAFALFKTPLRRMWLDVDDHARGVHAALRRGRKGEIYNLAPSSNSEAYTAEIIEQVRSLVGDGNIEMVEDRRSYTLRYLTSSEKAVRELGWRAQVSLAQSLSTTVDWYRQNRSWLEASAAATGV